MTAVKRFRNRDNFAKYQLFYYETGTDALTRTLEWLYQGQRPIEHYLEDLGKNRSNNLNASEKAILGELKNGTLTLTDLDLSLLYKIVQICCGLAARNESIWTKYCPPEQMDCIEYLLYCLKDGRNDLAHPSSKMKNISDQDVYDKCEAMKDLLGAILQKAGQRAAVEANEIDDVVSFVQNELERICNDDSIDEIMKPHVKNLILNDLKQHAHFSVEKDLKSYSQPYLKMEGQSFHLKDLLMTSQSQVTVVTGEAGEGKTALTRHLYHSWLSEMEEPVRELSSFDTVLRVECRHADTRDVSQFLEDFFPVASYSFSNTSSLKKHMDGFRILWIMDGFDECTAEFKGFLKAIIKRFPYNHKLIITTRPNMLAELQQVFLLMSVDVASLEILRDQNLDEITKYFIEAEDKREEFLKELHSISDDGKPLLKIPLNLKLYIELWLDDPAQAKGSYSANILFVKTTNLQLRRLEERLEERTPLPSSEDLRIKIFKWFYESLCKRSFIMALKGIKSFKVTEEITALKKEAGEYLIPSYCLSSFLIEARTPEDSLIYEFVHLTQQFTFAALYITHCQQCGNKVLSELVKTIPASNLRIVLEFYMKLVCDDSTINKDLENIFTAIRDLISDLKITEKHNMWCAVSVVSNFHEIFLGKLKEYLKNFDYWNATNADVTALSIAKFLSYIQPKKIRLIIGCLMEQEQKLEYLQLFEVIAKHDITFHIHALSSKSADYARNSAIIEANSSSMNIRGFSGIMPVLSLMTNHHKNLEELEIVIDSESDYSRICDFLCQTEFKNIICITIFFEALTDYAGLEIPSFPCRYISLTNVVFVEIENDKFELYSEFLSKLRGKETITFLSLQLYTSKNTVINTNNLKFVQEYSEVITVHDNFNETDTDTELVYQFYKVTNCVIM